MDETKQKAIWQLSGGYTHLDGFEPLTATPPRPAAPAVVNGEAPGKDATANNQEPKATETAGARFYCIVQLM